MLAVGRGQSDKSFYGRNLNKLACFPIWAKYLRPWGSLVQTANLTAIWVTFAPVFFFKVFAQDFKIKTVYYKLEDFFKSQWPIKKFCYHCLYCTWYLRFLKLDNALQIEEYYKSSFYHHSYSEQLYVIALLYLIL